MKKMTFAFVLFLVLGPAIFGQSVTVSPDELKPLVGSWTGELTYLDYGSNKRTSIRSNVNIGRSDASPRSWTFDYIYPDEPKANAKSDVKLGADGRIFNDQSVLERSKLPDGTLRLVTTKEGTDNNKKALFRYTYLIGKAKFTLLKEVRVEGTEAFFERNTYTWTR